MRLRAFIHHLSHIFLTVSTTKYIHVSIRAPYMQVKPLTLSTQSLQEGRMYTTPTLELDPEVVETPYYEATQCTVCGRIDLIL